jgi:hypothetical protein
VGIEGFGSTKKNPLNSCYKQLLLMPKGFCATGQRQETLVDSHGREATAVHQVSLCHQRQVQLECALSTQAHSREAVFVQLVSFFCGSEGRLGQALSEAPAVGWNYFSYACCVASSTNTCLNGMGSIIPLYSKGSAHDRLSTFEVQRWWLEMLMDIKNNWSPCRVAWIMGLSCIEKVFCCRECIFVAENAFFSQVKQKKNAAHRDHVSCFLAKAFSVQIFL